MSTATRTVRLQVNGREVVREVSIRQSLADFVRDDLGLTGTRLGCEHGVCGACTVIADAQPVRSCLMLAVQADGASVTTIEGLAASGEIDALREAFATNFAAQCGFCTAGMLVSATCLLRTTSQPTESAIRQELSGNLCRCTGYGGIVGAVQEVGRSNR